MSQTTNRPRIVITGLGVISAVGNNVDQYWDNLAAGNGGITKVTRFDASDVTSQVAGEVKDFDPKEWMGKKDANRHDRYVQFAVAASQMAVDDAKLKLDSIDLERI